MVRAGRHGVLFDQFEEGKFVSVGWRSAGPSCEISDKERLWDSLREAYSDLPDQSVSMAVGQLYRFAREMNIGDRVVTYDPGSRNYLCGLIAGPCEDFPDADQEETNYRRKVNWSHSKSRDDLNEPSRNTLGAISTIFLISQQVSDQLWSMASSTPHASLEQTVRETASPLELPFEQAFDFAVEKIKDKVVRLNWSQMQDLVAGVLRATGYSTTVSPAGPDRGRDITASPDGFGFQNPRIVVEVKHRPRERMSASDVRSFLGGRKPHECGLYVSTGGFTRDAYYEAERAPIPMTLMDFEALVKAVLDNYSKFDEPTKQLLRLAPIYWPL
jgi:restriction system protein